MDELINFWADPDYSPPVRMPEPDCFLRYRISHATRNYTSGKSDVYVLVAAATRGFTMVSFTEAVSRRNTFVGVHAIHWVLFQLSICRRLRLLAYVWACLGGLNIADDNFMLSIC